MTRAKTGRALRAATAVAALVAVATAAAPGWGPYVVKRGDTLWGLARSHHTSVTALQSANHLSGSLILIGQRLDVPGSGATGASAKSAGHGTTVRTTVAAHPSYTVLPGDTLTAIAQAHHSTVPTLAALNHLSGRLVILIGQRLTLPATSTRTATVFAATPLTPAYAAAITASARRLVATPAPDHATIRSMVAAEARRQGVDPALALAVADQESGFAQHMVSATDAVGVMQLEPGTAVWLADYSGQAVDRYLVGDNIRGGVMLLAILTRETSQPNAIAGYYQGLASVLARGMFADTKAYVASVQALESRFRAGRGR